MASTERPDTPRHGRLHDVRRPPRLSITLFGGIEIGFAGRDVPLGNRKARALLAYLALSDAESESRERLAGLLWSDSSEKNARTSLRQALFDLREAFNNLGCDALASDRRAVGLKADGIDLDLDLIFDDVSSGRVPEALMTSPRISETLLAGYEDLSPLFDEWIAGSRRAVEDRLLRALERGYENEAAPRKQRRRLAEAALLLDPLHEAACREVMRLAAQHGETGTALRTYARLYDALGEELDLEPSDETRDLAVKIKLRQFDPPSTDTGSVQDEAAAPSLVTTTVLGAPTVAVLPFHEIGPDPVPSYFSEGVVEDTVCMLATLREPVVISSNSTRHLRGQDVDLSQIGRNLGAQYIVSGTVRRADEQLRLSVELAEANSGQVLWASVYDTSDPRHLKTQDDIAASIARTLVPSLRDAELRRSRGQRPEDLSIYHLMLQARDLVFRLERPTFEQAGDMLRRAIAIDPGYAPTHVALANWYSLRIGQGWSPDEAADTRSLEAMARLATGLDTDGGRALAMLGHNRTILSREYDEALALFERALEASPNDAETLMWSSPTFAYLGDPVEAVRRAERAIALSPQDPFLFRYEHFLCIAHYAAGDFESAVHWGRCSLQRNPHYTSNLRMTAAALAGLGRAAEARSLVDKVLELQPGFRVSPLLIHQAFRDVDQRARYGEHLVEAGLPL